MIPVVALQMIPVIFGKMLSRTLSGGFAPPAAWQTTAVFFMVLSAARKRYCLRAMIIRQIFQYGNTGFTECLHFICQNCMPRSEHTDFIYQNCMPRSEHTDFIYQNCMPWLEHTDFICQNCMPRLEHTVFIYQNCMPRLEHTDFICQNYMLQQKYKESIHQICMLQNNKALPLFGAPYFFYDIIQDPRWWRGLGIRCGG